MSDAYARQPEPSAKEASQSVPKAPVGDTQTLGADDDHVRVGSADRDGLVVFGWTRCEACDRQPADEDAPRVIVRSFGGFGSVDIVRDPTR